MTGPGWRAGWPGVPRALTSLDARTCLPTSGVDRRHEPAQHPAAALSDLLQRPPAGGHRSDRPDQDALIRHDRSAPRRAGDAPDYEGETGRIG